ncbi:MAG: hypothetical protein ACI9KE_001381 [Polyangiales bacterium]|jgi:hypothetical protein
MIRFILLLGALFALCVSHSTAQAQYSDEHRRPNESREMFAFELGVGQYRPNVGNGAFEEVFASDQGPAVRLELDILPYRIPYVGRVGVGLNAGWSLHSAGACLRDEATNAINCDQRADEETEMRIWPLGLMAVLRIDVLARELSIPLLLTGKIGLDAVVYDLNTGARDDASGISFGLKWSAQVALELDFIRPTRARSLDEEWGINHTFLFVEMFGSTAASNLPVGTDLSWLAGLGMTF